MRTRRIALVVVHLRGAWRRARRRSRATGRPVTRSRAATSSWSRRATTPTTSRVAATSSCSTRSTASRRTSTLRRCARCAAAPAWQSSSRTSVVEASATQSIPSDPWGLDRIDQRALPLSRSYTYNTTASNVTAYVIDTGISTSHPDFGGRASDGLRRARRQRAGLPRPRDARGGHDRRRHVGRGEGRPAASASGYSTAPAPARPRASSRALDWVRANARQARRGQHVARRRLLLVAQHRHQQPRQLGRVHGRRGRQRESERLQRLPRLGVGGVRDGGLRPARTGRRRSRTAARAWTRTRPASRSAPPG